MLKSKKTIASIAIVGVLALVGALGFAAFSVKNTLANYVAQITGTPQANGQAQTNITKYEDLFIQSLATHLGVSVDKIKPAMQAAADDVIDQAVKDGKITQAQADQLKQEVASGNFPGGGFFLHGKGFGRGFGVKGFGIGQGLGVQEFASALGMTPQSLETELQAGKSIADVAAEKNVSLDQVKQKVLADLKTGLDTAVTNQKLTQAQADQIYQNASSKIDQVVQQKGFVGGKHRGWKGWNNPQASPSATPGAGM